MRSVIGADMLSVYTASITQYFFYLSQNTCKLITNMNKHFSNATVRFQKEEDIVNYRNNQPWLNLFPYSSLSSEKNRIYGII